MRSVTSRAPAVVAVIVVVSGVVWWRMRASHPTPTAPVQKQDAVRHGATPDRREPEPDVQVLIDNDPRGALRLEGQVVDVDDHPVAGATVVLSSNPPRTATTEADGGFAFDALVARPYTLVARAAHGVAGPVTARLNAKSDPIVLHLRPAAKVTTTVS